MTFTKSRYFAVLLLGIFVVMSGHHWNQGLADNGDFARNIRMFSPGPPGIKTAPASGSDVWNQRYFRYWIPEWRFDFSPAVPFTSAVLLWLPGILVNAAVLSSDILHTSVATIGVKLCLLALLAVVVGWIDARHRDLRNTLYICLVVPLTLMLSSTEYQLYLNSFYQEAGSLVYCIAFLIAVGAASLNGRMRWCSYAVVALGLFATVRLGNLYWLVFGTAILTAIVVFESKLSRKKKYVLIIGAWSICAVLLGGSILIVKRYATPTNSYHSLFVGTLTFSDRPTAHLERLGMIEAQSLIGVPAFTREGLLAREQYKDKLGFGTILDVVAHEPVVATRMINHAASQMQDLSLRYLGRFSASDPRSIEASIDTSIVAQQERSNSGPILTYLTLWSWTKYHFFPRGITLFLVLGIFGGWFAWTLRRSQCPELSIVGLITTIGCFSEMMVAIFGDGRFELMKHLFMANAFFDFSTIAFSAVLATSLVKNSHKQASARVA